MILFQKRIQKRRMPDEKIAQYVKAIEFNRDEAVWMDQFETVLHKILICEFYLDKIPDNLSLPKYRSIIVRVVYRMLCQAPSDLVSFSRNISPPDPIIRDLLNYFRVAELRRKQELFERYPVTGKKIESILAKLKEDLEI